MNWGTSFLLALLTAGAGLLLGGAIASGCVRWYQISSFEGGAGYFVVGLALVGAIAGFVIGMAVARIGGLAGFGQRFLVAWGIVAAIGAFIAVPARLLADVAPEIDGEQLLIAFEFKLMPNATDPRALAGPPLATLGSSSGGVQRVSEDGPLLVEDARLEEGRWIVPGAVRLFTERGQRVLGARIGDTEIGYFILPIPRSPDATQPTWTDWFPRGREGSPPLPDGVRYRFKLLRTSQPFRVQRVGPFRVETQANYFYRVQQTPRLAAYASFAVFHGDTAIDGLREARAVAVIPGDVPSLLVNDGSENPSGQCVLLVDAGGELRRVPAGSCNSPLAPRLLTNDAAAFARQRAAVPVPGWLDTVSFSDPGLYRIDHAVIDTRARTATAFDLPTEPFPQDPPGLILLSPDERSVVWFAFGESGESEGVLGVTRFADATSYTLPIERARMRYREHAEIDPAWVTHHFAWVKDATGRDSLVQRASFTPLPHRGQLALGKAGEYQAYYLKPGSDRLRAALVDWLVKERGGQRVENQNSPDEPDVAVDGETYGVSFVESGDMVALSTYHGDPEALRRIAAALDALLATGRFDAFFGPAPEPKSP